ncbi:hypothetical protein MBLNU230_g3841t1 [Neophaeotheca triangularis]
MLSDSAATAITGAAFGASLAASGVYLPSVIIDQFHLTDFHMFHVFATAMGSSAIAMLFLDKLNIVQRPVKSNSTLGWSSYDANIAGGILVGVGMALSGACPGTVLVQLAQGIPSANATALGALLGAGIYVQTQNRLKNMFRRQGAAEPSTRNLIIAEALRIPEVVLYPLFGLAIMAVLRFTGAKIGNSLVAPIIGGLLIGSAQALSLVLTSSPLGVSSVYEHLSRHIVQVLAGKLGKSALPSKPIIFSLGVIAGSFALLQQKPGTSLAVSDAGIPAWQAFVGGTVLAFGARLGGGCTSGHGLSGLSAMSFSSLITVACMFGAGILTRTLM